MEPNLRGYRALVTASTRGIGRGIAEVFIECGAKVVVNGRRPEGVERALNELRNRYISSQIYGVTGDLRNPDERAELVRRTAKLLGGLDTLVYVTGPPKPGEFLDLRQEDWREGIELLVMSAIDLVRESIAFLKESDNGSIILLTSVAVREPIPNLALSNILRIAVHGLVKTLSKEVGKYGIRVNAIMPGYILTDRVRQLAEEKSKRLGISTDEALKDFVKNVPLGRIGTPREVGYLAAFLASPFASYINGSSIPIDGGLLSSVF
ncbi:MAG TPA: SDR family oxidoreductase [Thermoprotei archaeon]|nr:SDR family oxidoreductase [Thermoprotei archaeon]